MYVCRCFITAGENVPMRSVSDDQLLSHSEAFTRDCSTPNLRCDSDDFRNLTKSDDIAMKQRPSCNHDVPENCTSSCWTFTNCDDTGQCVMPHGESDNVKSDSSTTRYLPITKSKSTDHCCLHDGATGQPAVNQSTCFYLASW